MLGLLSTLHLFERWIDDMQTGQSIVGKALGNISESRFRIVVADIVHLAEGERRTPIGLRRGSALGLPRSQTAARLVLNRAAIGIAPRVGIAFDELIDQISVGLCVPKTLPELMA